MWGSLVTTARRDNDLVDEDDMQLGTTKWIFLGYWDDSDRKPSGLPLGQYTAEDERAGVCEGIGNDFPREHWTPVRYIRFDCIESWGLTFGINMNEMTFWGDPYDI